MPTLANLAVFEASALPRLQQPIQVYYRTLDQVGKPSLEARVAQSLARVEMERLLRQLHTEAALIGANGTLDPDQRGILRDIISNDLRYLNRFMDALPTLTRAQALARCQAYLTTLRHTANEMAALKLPWLPVYPGDRHNLICKWHCKCALDIKKVNGVGNWDVYWQRSARESCSTCRALEAAWRPLRIRGGKIVEGQSLSKASEIRAIKAVLGLLDKQPTPTPDHVITPAADLRHTAA
jgi:hypothetical protein